MSFEMLAEPDEVQREVAERVSALGDAVLELARRDHAADLLRIMRRPGWTTPDEARLVGAMANHLHDLVLTTHQAHDALVRAASRIGLS